MEQQNDAVASPPSPTATKQPKTAIRQLGNTKGDTAGRRSLVSQGRKSHRRTRSHNAADASPARSRGVSRSRSPAVSSSTSPAASRSDTSPSRSPRFKNAVAGQERKDMRPASRTLSRTPTAGLTSMTPPSTERTPRALQPSARSTKIDAGGGRLIGASADRKVDATAESVDLGTSLPIGTAEIPTPETPAKSAGHSPAVRGRGTANVLAALQKRVSTATAEFRLGTPIRPRSAPRSPSCVNPAYKYHSPMSGTSTLLAGSPISKEHTLLKTELIVGCVSCIVLVFLLVFGVTKIALSPAPVTSKHCLTHACRAYSERLFTSINRSVNPCAHFTRFVCDGWQRRQNLDVWEDRFLLFMNRLDATLNSIRIPATGQNDEQRAAALYRSCYNVFHGPREELGAVKEALASAGITWPQPSRGADALFTLLYSSLKLGWDTLLNFRVVPRSGESTDELVVSQGRSFDTLREWFVQERATTVKRAYFEFIRDNFASSGGNGTTVGTAVTYDQTWDIAEPAMNALLPFFVYSRVSPVPADWFASSSSANLTVPRWTGALRRVNVSLGAGLRISSDNPVFLRTMLVLWENYREDRFHLFVSWCTVQVAALYANRDLILNYYDQIPDRARLYRKAFCVSKAVFFSPSLIARYNGNALHSNATAVAKEMVLSVRLAFSRRLFSWPHYDPKVTVVADWNSLDSAFREFEYEERKHGSEASDVMPDMTNSFLANWQHSVLLNITREVTQLSYAVRHLWMYSSPWGEHDFRLMPYTVSFPFFDTELPTSINFGGFGSEVVAALGSLLFESYKAQSDATVFSCLKRGPSGKEYPEEYVAGTIGYRALLDAFRQVPRTTWLLEGLEQYSDIQLLFISSCFVVCPGSQRGQQNECDILAQRVPEFAEAFECSKETVGTNASEHCQFL